MLAEWLGSLPMSVPMLAAPVATYLNYKIGTRPTVFIGVLVVSVSLAVTSKAPNLGTLYAVYGVCVSIGATLVVNPPFFLLDEYFPYEHPRHVLTTSIIACAFPMGKKMGVKMQNKLCKYVIWIAFQL